MAVVADVAARLEKLEEEGPADATDIHRVKKEALEEELEEASEAWEDAVDHCGTPPPIQPRTFITRDRAIVWVK